MKSFENFKDEVVKELTKKAEEKGMEVYVKKVTKVNEVLHGVSLVKADKPGKITPTVYLEDYYGSYLMEKSSISSVAEKIFRTLSVKRIPGFQLNFDKNRILNSVVFQLVNTERNKEMLTSRMCRDWNDLSIIYKVNLLETEEGVYSIPIRREDARKFGITESELYEAAYKNTRETMGACVFDISAMMEFAQGCITGEELASMDGKLDDGLLYCITNFTCRDGAVMVLYEELLEKIAARFDSNLYLIPSSIHEFIAVPDADIGLDNMATLKAEMQYANRYCVSEQSFLSDTLYYYDRNTKTVKPAEEQE